MFVHTNIVILAKFVATLMEKPGDLKSQFFMKSLGCGVRQNHKTIDSVNILGFLYVFNQL